jgi:hypothetical protein
MDWNICRFWKVRDMPRRASLCGAIAVTSSPPSTPARTRAVDARDHVEQRGLAGAVRPDDRDDSPGFTREADIVDGLQAAEADAQAFDGQQGLIRWCPPDLLIRRIEGSSPRA